jgi:hypothetical protein
MTKNGSTQFHAFSGKTKYKINRRYENNEKLKEVLWLSANCGYVGAVVCPDRISNR